MKKIFLALILVAASLNIAACSTHKAVDGKAAAAEERATRAQAAANDGLRK